MGHQLNPIQVKRGDFMRPHRQVRQAQFQLEALEGRIALSGVGGGLDDGSHHHRGREVEVRHAADDAANHNANDDKGGAKAHRHGADDAATHNAHDDKGGAKEHRHGADDPAGHR